MPVDFLNIIASSGHLRHAQSTIPPSKWPNSSLWVQNKRKRQIVNSIYQKLETGTKPYPNRQMRKNRQDPKLLQVHWEKEKLGDRVACHTRDRTTRGTFRLTRNQTNNRMKKRVRAIQQLSGINASVVPNPEVTIEVEVQVRMGRSCTQTMEAICW